MGDDHPQDNARSRALWRARDLGLKLVGGAPLTWEGDLPFKGGAVRVKIQLSDDYPALPPKVWRLGPDGEVLGGYVGHHTFVLDKSLCLFRDTGGEGAWRSEYGLDEVIERLRQQAEGSAAGALGEHGSDLDLPFVRDGKTLILSSAQAEILQGEGPAWGWVKALVNPKIGVTASISVTIGSDKHRAHQGLPPPWQHDTHPLMPWMPRVIVPQEGLWIRVPNTPWSSLLPDTDALTRLLRAHLHSVYVQAAEQAPFLVLVRGAGERDMLVIYNVLAGALAQRKHLPLFAALSEEAVPAEARHTAWVRVADLSSMFFARNTPLLAPAITDAHVALVGLGSLGAPVAILLAQAGIRRFTLFDPDKLQPENLSRYPIGAEGLGQLKGALVHAKILAHNPWAEVLPCPLPPLADGPRFNALKTVLDDPNGLIVCTCADPHVEADLNRLAVAHNRPLIIGAAMGAAEHARILRVLPGESACLHCVLLHQRDDPERFPKFEPTEDVGSWAYAGEGIAGLGLDTQEIAAKIARHTLQTLGLRLGGLPYGDAWGDHLLWTRVGGWVFEHPGQTVRVPTTRRPDCEVCHPQAGSSQEDEEALITLLLDEGRG